jgi:hypothetical protein
LAAIGNCAKDARESRLWQKCRNNEREFVILVVMMNKRVLIVMGLGVVLLTVCTGAPASVAPIPLSCGPHFLIDDYLIASQSDIERVTNHPTRNAQPIVDSANDGNWQTWVTVIRDPQTGRFRMW